MTEKTEVLIVGGGMVGLSAAAFLAWHKVPTVLVERHPRSSLHPRAMGFTTRTMELYRAIGLGDAIPQIPPGFSRPRRVQVESLAGTWFKEEVTWTPGQSDIPANAARMHELSPCTGAAIPQDQLEPIIRARAVELGSDIRLATEMISFEYNDDEVIAHVCQHDRGKYSIRANYIVAADGNASPIREALGIGRDGRGHLQTMRSVLFRAPLEEYLESGASQFEIRQPDFAGMLTTYRDGRWLLMSSDDIERDEPTLKAMINRAIGRSDLNIEIITTGRWELSALIAERYRVGRIFLAGDAAHTLPPARGGYGANTGIEDAHNLAWKVASVISGAASAALLDTYEEERKPIAWLRHGQIFARPDYAKFARPADKDVPIIDDDAMELGQRYQSSAVWGNGEELPSALRPGQWMGQPGTRAPHVWVVHDGKRASTLDLVQPDWVLLTQDDDWYIAAQQATSQLGILVRGVLVSGSKDGQLAEAGSPLGLSINDIISQLSGRTVLETVLPQVFSHPAYETFKAMSLRQLQPLSGGQIAVTDLAAIETELKKVLDFRAFIEPVDAGTFLIAFGIGDRGASLVRPDGYIARRFQNLPIDPGAELVKTVRDLSCLTFSRGLSLKN